jgi:hypothetical protein
MFTIIQFPIREIKWWYYNLPVLTLFHYWDHEIMVWGHVGHQWTQSTIIGRLPAIQASISNREITTIVVEIKNFNWYFYK